MPRICIATITLNNAQGIEKTWESINHQTNKDYKWLVQDGGSNDNSVNVLQKTPAIYKSIKDNGIYNAMNRLITRANAENSDYILFLNAGDTLASPKTLETIIAALDEKPDFLYGDALEHVSNGVTNYKTARNHNRTALGMFTHHQSMLYKISAIGDLRYNETYTIAADYDFTARFLKSAKSVKYIPAPICIFEPGGISQIQTTKGRQEQFQIRKALGLCPPIQNHIITMLQSINMAFRNTAPNLYWSLKRR